MENNKFDKRTMNIRTGLGLVGIQVDLKVAYLVDNFMIAFNEEGSELTLDELTDIKFKAEKFFNEEITEREMTLEDLRWVAINCKTRQEADDVTRLFFVLKFPIVGRHLNNDAYIFAWDRIGNKMCVTLKECVGYDKIDFYKEKGYTIKPAQWFLDNFTPKDKEELK